MSELWYNNLKILLTNPDQFYPNNSLTRVEKINSLARFAIYYTIIVWMIGLDTNSNLYMVGIIVLLISYFLETNEKFTERKFTESKSSVIKNNCQKPTKENPFMNYTLGDLIDNKNRLPACNYEDVKDEIKTEFRSDLHTDTSDIWGKFISDRNFYTMPNTDIVNDQTGFAQWCFGNSGECKTTGQNCLKQRDPTYHHGRVTAVDYNDYY